MGAKRKGIGNIHTHHLDLECLPENLSAQQSKGIPEWVQYITILKPLLDKYHRRFFEVMSSEKEYSEVARFHIEDMDKAKIDYSAVLHIDFEGADPKAKDQNYQYEYVIDKIAQACAKYPFRFFPLFGFDPRRPNVVKMLKTCFKDRCFVGIKLYPALGFYPRSNKSTYSNKNGDYYVHNYHKYPKGGILQGNDILDNLKRMYEFAGESKIPILLHCGPGGSYRVAVTNEERYEKIWRYTNPQNFRDIAKDYGLRICFGHMGGQIDDKKKNKTKEDENSIQWNKKICELIVEADGWAGDGRLYADQSYDIVHLIRNETKKKKLEASIERTKGYLDESVLGKYILFGSDWPLNIYKCSEKQYIDEYRKRLDGVQQKKYFSDNIATYLFGKSNQIPHNYINYLKSKNKTLELPDWVEESNGDYFLK